MNDDMTENDVDCQTFDLYQIKNSDSQSMGLKKVETQIENQNSDPLLYQRTLFINEELLEVEKEKIDKNIYEIGIIFEEIIYLIIIQCIECKFDIFIYPKYQLDHINQYLVLKYIFKIHTTPEQIRNQINKAKNYIQKDNEHLQKMARVWFDLNKFKQNGEDLLNYFDAFEIMNTMFKQQSQIFADFLMFLAERYYQSEVIITSELYNQILQTFFPLRNNDQIEHPFIQEFFNAKQNIYD
ncbi:unnamed protein product [Paramecium octaurelia]|uniref:Uncharacterized protein n=1 Tax=Paramecium octaurelia TaxID=43137 RepID=A0A8S1SZN1_PAROT|nr:unnamed protein product [Paramecium octaurelia]